jgi:hypothetical protein
MYPDTMHKKDILPNVSVVLGGAGTGKTVAIAGISAEMLSFDDDVEFVYLAPSKKQADNLASNVQKPGTILTIDSLDEFFEEKPIFYPEKKDKDGKLLDVVIRNGEVIYVKKDEHGNIIKEGVDGNKTGIVK